MSESKFKYPVDTADFQSIRESGKLYVDKTDLVHRLVDDYKYVFLARPRRFGKSLLCSTLQAYFEGKRELFEGLKIMESEREWKSYPVLHFSMSDLKNISISEAKTKLDRMLRSYERVYGRDELSVTPGSRLSDLIRNARELTGERAVVIVDEYDAPILKLLHDRERLEPMRAMLREFYQVLKDEDANIRFVFLTGVTKFSQLSIFSELNNLIPITMDDEYSGLCGITSEELEGVMRECVEEYASDLGITTEEAYATLRKNYDGYHFSKRGKDVYAPFSLLRALKTRTTGQFWFESGTPSSLIEHLRHFPGFNPFDVDGVALRENEFNKPCEDAETPIPLLYQAGYLTIKSYDPKLKRFLLHFPNYEVRQGMADCLTNYLTGIDSRSRNATIYDMAVALHGGDVRTALTALRSFIANIPYDIISKKEWMAKKDREDFFKLLMYIVFTLLNNEVETEVKSVRGRADVVIKTESDIFVLELKVDRDVDDALAQIDDKGYAIPYQADGRRVTKCGVSISSEMRNIEHWKATDADGTTLDEEKY